MENTNTLSILNEYGSVVRNARPDRQSSEFPKTKKVTLHCHMIREHMRRFLKYDFIDFRGSYANTIEETRPAEREKAAEKSSVDANNDPRHTLDLPGGEFHWIFGH